MTYVAGRRGKSWKTHDNIGHVKNSIGSLYYGHHCFAYEFKDGKYVLMWAIPAGTKIEDLPWKKYVAPPYVPQCRHVAGCGCKNH